jgi:hypothetical protein
MKKFVFALVLIATSAIPALAQYPPQGFWNTQFQNPFPVTGNNYMMSVDHPVVLVNSPNGASLTLPPCWSSQRYDVLLGPQASTIGTAVFTGTGAGATLTVSAVNSGVIAIGSVISGIGVPPGTTITSQTGGATGGVGVYSTSTATTASASLLISGAVTASPGGSDTWLSGGSGALLLGAYGIHIQITAVGSPGGSPSCSWIVN